MKSLFSVRLSRPSVEHVFLLLLLAILVLFSVRTVVKVLDNRSAFRRWQPQLLQLQQGVDLSAQFNYPNPPIMAVLLEPLARLPPVPAALVWFWLKAAMAVLAVYWVLRLVDSDGRRFPGWAWILVVLCGLKPILDDLSHGNVNLLILFLVVASLRAYQGRFDFLAGILLALAIACKITPALYVPYFLWKRAWQVLAGCVVGLGLFLWPGVVPSLRIGMHENQQQLVSWYRVMAQPYLRDGKVTSEHVNQSLPGLVARLATDSPSFVGWVGDIETPLRHDNLLALSPRVAKGLVQGAMLLFAVLVVVCCRTTTEHRQGWRLPAEFALIALGMLLFSERTWKHHAVLLVLPFAVLIYALARVKLERGWQVGLLGVVLICMVLLLLPAMGGGKDRFVLAAAPDLAKMAQVYGAYTWAFLLLAGTMVVLLRNKWPTDEGYPPCVR
jgi:hypothetical protein